MIFSIYGGPGSQEVYDQFSGTGWLQWLAQRGYIVVGVNNRATNNYGSAFMKIVYGNLGKWESHDFAETARHLATLPYVDAKSMAIIGTSYGGYASLFTMEQYPDLFPVGIANSTVADWRFYDSIYTERYMGLPAENKSGYDASSPLVNAGQAERAPAADPFAHGRQRASAEHDAASHRIHECRARTSICASIRRAGTAPHTTFRAPAHLAGVGRISRTLATSRATDRLA